ncbi:hypothetical protein CsSME_00014247 [Camellia sinensis var. sinensis]
MADFRSCRVVEIAAKKSSLFCHVIPRHTKVVVTGNNRTKSVLVGLRGVVLTNGIEVKLQRKALSVIEAPTGNEDDDDLEFENVQWNGSDLGELASDDTQKSYRSRHRMHKLSWSSHKTTSRSLSCESQSKGSSVSTPWGSTKVDLNLRTCDLRHLKYIQSHIGSSVAV